MRHFKLILREDGKPPEELAVEIDGARYATSTRRAASRRGRSRRACRTGACRCSSTTAARSAGGCCPGGDGEVEVTTAAGRRTRIALAEPLRDRLAHAAGRAARITGDEEIRALMPGRVVEVAVAAGDRVAAGSAAARPRGDEDAERDPHACAAAPSSGWTSRPAERSTAARRCAVVRSDDSDRLSLGFTRRVLESRELTDRSVIQ